MSDRYIRNKECISDAEQAKLAGLCAAVVGLGGLGGHCAELLARLGFGRLVLVDDERVEESNLNRQLFATSSTLGLLKADAAKLRLQEVNPECRLRIHALRLNEENAANILQEADIVLDAVDNVPARLLLQDVCARLGKVLVHGAIGGWYGQVGVVFPGDNTLSRLYPDAGAGAEARLGNPSFIPALVAAAQVAEALKCCLGENGKGTVLRHKIWRIDLLAHKHMVINLANG